MPRLVSFSILALLIIIPCLGRAYNGTRGDGGGGYLCTDPETGHQALFSIDVLLAGPSLSHDFGSKPTSTSILNQIQFKLATKNSALAAGLHAFILTLQKSEWRSDAKGPAVEKSAPDHLWHSQCQKNMGCLGDLADDQTGGATPGCRKIQIAERVPVGGAVDLTVVTLIDLPALAMLEQDPLESSYFYLHEWLRDFVADASSIRKIDRYLHSEAFFDSGSDSLHIDSSPSVGQGVDANHGVSAASALSFYRQYILNPRNQKYDSLIPEGDQKMIAVNEVFPKDAAMDWLLVELKLRQQIKGVLSSTLQKRGDRYWLITTYPGER